MSKPKLALTFDLELWHESDWMQPYITPELRSQPDGFPESINSILMLLKHYGHRATFFVTGTALETYPDVLRTISEAGHEIGSHCYRHIRFGNMPPEKFEENMQTHVLAIEAISGKLPKGFRAPHFSLSAGNTWLLPAITRLGFKYDSSVFPIRTPQYGIQGAPRRPYKISFKDVKSEDFASPILEIPPSVVALGPALIPASGGVYFRFMPISLFVRLNRLAARKSLPVLYFHPHELLVDTPRIQGPLHKTWLKYMNVERSMEKFQILCEQFQFDSIENLLNI